MRSSVYFMSCPSVPIVSSAKRNASAPYCPAASSGFTTFPRDFAIFTPLASRMSPWKMTVRKGMSPSGPCSRML